MIKRIVKMTFRPDSWADFLDIFEKSCERIRASEGCHHLELVQDVNSPEIFFTLSIWEDEESLNGYRNSELFAATWEKTKALFGDRPSAWSTNVVHVADT